MKAEIASLRDTCLDVEELRKANEWQAREIERMKPVVEAACAWVHSSDYLPDDGTEVDCGAQHHGLFDSVRDYEAKEPKP